MVKEILTAAGFKEGETFKETRFLKPPKKTYAVYNDTFSRRGADNLNMITDHTITIEVYAYAPDPESEANVEYQLDSRGLRFDKVERYWIEQEQLYQTIYTFQYLTKEVNSHE